MMAYVRILGELDGENNSSRLRLYLYAFDIVLLRDLHKTLDEHDSIRTFWNLLHLLRVETADATGPEHSLDHKSSLSL